MSQARSCFPVVKERTGPSLCPSAGFCGTLRGGIHSSKTCGRCGSCCLPGCENCQTLPLTSKPGKFGASVGHINGKVSLACSVWFWLAKVACLSFDGLQRSRCHPHVDVNPKLCPDCGLAFSSNKSLIRTGSMATALRLDHMQSKTDGAQRVVVISGAA